MHAVEFDEKNLKSIIIDLAPLSQFLFVSLPKNFASLHSKLNELCIADSTLSYGRQYLSGAAEV
jgi:hypothetical protein